MTYNPYSKNNVVNDSEDETVEETDICFEDYMQNEDSSTWLDPDSNPDAVSSQSCRWLMVVCLYFMSLLCGKPGS